MPQHSTTWGQSMNRNLSCVSNIVELNAKVCEPVHFFFPLREQLLIRFSMDSGIQNILRISGL